MKVKVLKEFINKDTKILHEKRYRIDNIRGAV